MEWPSSVCCGDWRHSNHSEGFADRVMDGAAGNDHYVDLSVQFNTATVHGRMVVSLVQLSARTSRSYFPAATSMVLSAQPSQ